MITTRPLTPNAVEIIVDGALAREDIPRVIADVVAVLEGTDRLDMIADVRGAPDLHLSLFLEELKHLPALFRIMKALDRVALIADESWIRTAAKIESKLLPGIAYEVFTRAEEGHARDWALRRTDIAHA
ncbi:STAS/SEC14 domain-containing protein [Sphingobium aquiterrae]|uniref:STAS/SEC14 domain-containing protein n=1 Tax=Sphingobium aquiterrae TaxID=2038656 RepID=UPI003019CC2E